MRGPYEDWSAYHRHPVYLAACAIAERQAHYKCSCGHRADKVIHRNGYPTFGTFCMPSELRLICNQCIERETG
jgi:hypothetical protein